MSGTFILIPIAILIALVAILGLIGWALAKASSTTYYCACRELEKPCWNQVPAPGFVCVLCQQGNHSGHMR